MFRKENQNMSSNVSVASSQEEESIQLWQKLTETEQEVTKGGFYFPSSPTSPLPSCSAPTQSHINFSKRHLQS